MEKDWLYMKKYFAPEMNLVEYETDEIMTASTTVGDDNIPDAPGIEDATDNL